MGLSNKAINKFSKFTAALPPKYKQNRAGLAGKGTKVQEKSALTERIRACAATRKVG